MTVQERPPPGRYRLRIEDYERLAEAGTFGDARTELLDGEIIVMPPEHRPHAWVKNELHYRLRRRLEEIGSDLYVTDGSVLLSPNDMPQPDIVLTREPIGPGAIPLASVALLVEVASTTLDRDIAAKAQLYAVAGIPEYWVADVNARVIHQLWAPAGEAYGERREAAFGERIEAATLQGLEIENAALN